MFVLSLYSQRLTLLSDLLHVFALQVLLAHEMLRAPSVPMHSFNTHFSKASLCVRSWVPLFQTTSRVPDGIRRTLGLESASQRPGTHRIHAGAANYLLGGQAADDPPLGSRGAQRSWGPE